MIPISLSQPLASSTIGDFFLSSSSFQHRISPRSHSLSFPFSNSPLLSLYLSRTLIFSPNLPLPRSSSHSFNSYLPELFFSFFSTLCLALLLSLSPSPSLSCSLVLLLLTNFSLSCSLYHSSNRLRSLFFLLSISLSKFFHLPMHSLALSQTPLFSLFCSIFGEHILSPNLPPFFCSPFLSFLPFSASLWSFLFLSLFRFLFNPI